MAIEHMKTWKIGRVEITRLVEVWKWEDDIWMVLEDSKPPIVHTQPWLLPDHATPEGRMFINFQAFVVTAGNRRVMIGRWWRGRGRGHRHSGQPAGTQTSQVF